TNLPRLRVGLVLVLSPRSAPRSEAPPRNALPCEALPRVTHAPPPEGGICHCDAPISARQSLEAVRSQAEPGNEDGFAVGRRYSGPYLLISFVRQEGARQMQTERVLVVPTKLFHRLGRFQGFSHEAGRYLGELLKPEHV